MTNKPESAPLRGGEVPLSEKKQPGRPAAYGEATPEQVAKALLTHHPTPQRDAASRQP